MYYIRVSHAKLGKYRVVSGSTEGIAQARASAISAEWDRQYEKVKENELKIATKLQARRSLEEKVQHAAELTAESEATLLALQSLLSSSLKAEHRIDFEGSKANRVYSEEPPTCPPVGRVPPAPDSADAIYAPKFSLLDKLFASRAKAKKTKSAELLASARAAWSKKVAEIDEMNRRLRSRYDEAVDKYAAEKVAHEKKVDEQNAAIDALAVKYARSEPDAVQEYCEGVLNNSEFPDQFPREWELSFDGETGTAVVDYKLPAVEQLPTRKEVKYVKSKDEFKETHMKSDERNALFDSVVYQCCLRVLHELFSADVANAIKAIVFNGIVTSVNKGTGRTVTACIISVHATKAVFQEINLAQVDPKACFRSLRGVGSSQLHSITPVAPILQISREDRRFIQAREVADGLDDSVNLAAMDWEDFEHLIREVFEYEFKVNGGEVKVTQASRDGGVDAVAFDPDPIRGGKIVIQAKRYTNTVGVSAVRDLYGTLMNEGAIKGILVTTSDFGPDAFEFIKGKPLALLNGSNLLFLLQKHGKRAKIDIREAKKILGEAVQ
ncbi:MAG TPA: restriction endonuclease [Candidatus Didemnitutus sp.]|nr:restriction endonuclease [Candidatus Didemnitutus sp.]